MLTGGEEYGLALARWERPGGDAAKWTTRSRGRRIAGLRGILADAYFGIDNDIVWSVGVEEVLALLPPLRGLRSRLRTTVARLSSTDN